MDKSNSFFYGDINLDEDGDFNLGSYSSSERSGSESEENVERSGSESVENADLTADEEEIEVNDFEETEVNGDYYKSIIELTADDIIRLEFESEEKACDFYNAYAKWHGFIMRKDDRKKDSKGNFTARQLVCNKEGLRKTKHLIRDDRIREHRALTRTKCPAKLRVKLDKKSGKWKVTTFVKGHNHKLTPPKYAHLVSANRWLTEADKAQVDSLRCQGVRTCHIMGFMVAQKGRYDKVGFCKKDLYNHFEWQKHDRIKDGDASAALSYLRGKAEKRNGMNWLLLTV